MKIYIPLFFLLLNTCIYAQQAPDFTATDINGNEHSLYEDYLNQDKAVIIDFSATWCEPCWELHQQHPLNEIYDALGPEGTDEITVLFVESDGYSPEEALYGQGNQTLGNWVEGTPYPFINENGENIASSFNVQGYPTVFMVCPDGNIQLDLYDKYGDRLNFSSIFEELYTCLPISTLADDARIVRVVSSDHACGLVDATVTLQNFGTDAISSGQFTIYRNGDLYENQAWGNTIASKAMLEIALENLEVDPVYEVNEFRVVLDDDENNENNEFVFTVGNEVKESTLEVILRLAADDYTSSETSFVLLDSEGNTVDTSGVIPDGALFERTFNLDAVGCYQLKFNDVYKDGVRGAVSLVDSDNDTLLYKEQFRPFETYTLNFRTKDGNSATVNINEQASIELFPNVSASEATLRIHNAAKERIRIDIFDATGRLARHVNNEIMHSGVHEWTLSNLETGHYFVSVITPSAQQTLKFIKL